MPKSNVRANAALAAYFTATDDTGISTNSGSPLTNLYVTLHTASPGKAGTQATNAVVYTGYIYEPVSRPLGWTVSGNQASNAAAINFPQATGSGDNTTATHWGIGRASSGAGTLDYFGPIGTDLGEATATTDGNVRIPGLTGLSVGDKFVAVALADAPMPGGITEGTTYFVKTVASDVITLSATLGGSVLTISGDGAFVAYKHTPINITFNGIPQISIGGLTVFED